MTIALKIAEWDAEKAAGILKIDISRLMGFLRGHTDLYRQVELKTIYPFISIQEGDDGITITIKPDKRFNRVLHGQVGDEFIVKLDRANSKHRGLIRRAEAIARDKE